MTTPLPPNSLDRSRFLDEPRLLERELMGLRLHELIAELEQQGNELPQLPQGTSAGTTLGDLLGDNETHVLERGLASLPESRVQTLLDQPALLLELQELLLGRGGAYWDQVTESLPELGRVRLSEAQWQERLAGTFVRRPRSQSKARGDQPPSQAPAPAPAPAPAFWASRRGGLTAALITVALLGMAAPWYRAETRLAAARREHADEAVALRNSFDIEVAAVRQEQAGERVAAYCRVLHRLSSLPATEELVSLPRDDSPDQGDSLPPDEDLVAEEQLPAAEEALVSLSDREQIMSRVADALRRDRAAWGELTREARQYLEHADPQVSHGAALALKKIDN